MAPFDLTLGHGEVAATMVASAQPSGGAVLFVHGLGSDRQTNIERAEALTAAHGTTCLAIDLRGHGASAGRLSEVTPAQNLADVVAGYDYLAQHADVDPARIGLCGASYGAYLSVLAAGERQAARIMLRAPALYSDDGVHATLGRRRLGDETSARGFLSVLTGVESPVMLVESERDEVIPHAVVQTYRTGLPGIQHVVLADAAHALTEPAWRAAYEHLVVDFFAEL
jgi:pimeloyl-ACP methyl ester carboxylesterase